MDEDNILYSVPTANEEEIHYNKEDNYDTSNTFDEIFTKLKDINDKVDSGFTKIRQSIYEIKRDF